MSLPSVTIVITSHNRGQLLAESLSSALEQQYDKLEVVLVDDGSSDSTTLGIVEAARSLPRVRVIQQANAGLGAARNAGVRSSSSEFIMCLDDDDILAPTYVKKCAERLLDDSSLGVVYSLARKFGTVNKAWDLPEFSTEAMVFGNVVFAAGLFRRSDWLTVGGYSEDLPHYEDYDFWIRLLMLGRGFARVPEELFFYRVGHASRLRRDDPRRELAIRQAMLQIYDRNEGFYRLHGRLIFEKLHANGAELRSLRSTYGRIDRIFGGQVRRVLSIHRWIVASRRG